MAREMEMEMEIGDGDWRVEMAREMVSGFARFCDTDSAALSRNTIVHTESTDYKPMMATQRNRIHRMKR